MKRDCLAGPSAASPSTARASIDGQQTGQMTAKNHRQIIGRTG